MTRRFTRSVAPLGAIIVVPEGPTGYFTIDWRGAPRVRLLSRAPLRPPSSPPSFPPSLAHVPSSLLFFLVETIHSLSLSLEGSRVAGAVGSGAGDPGRRGGAGRDAGLPLAPRQGTRLGVATEGMLSKRVLASW